MRYSSGVGARRYCPEIRRGASESIDPNKATPTNRQWRGHTVEEDEDESKRVGYGTAVVHPTAVQEDVCWLLFEPAYRALCLAVTHR